MAKFGAWEAKFNKNFPQKIASAVAEPVKILGATYQAIAFLGTQPVNGTNNAVLAEQTLENGRDTKNAVVMIFNEKQGSNDVSLAGIRPIAESGGALGGTEIEVTLDIPEEAKAAFDIAKQGYVGATVTPVAYLGKQLVNGMNYVMIAEVTGAYPGAATELAVITVNSLYKIIKFADLFELGDDEKSAFAGVKMENGKLGYAFTWLTGGDLVKNWP